MKTSNLCTTGNIVGNALSISEALKHHGVYRFKPSNSGAALVVTTDAVAYVNDGHVAEYDPSIHPGTVWLTDLPCPAAIQR